MYDFNGGFDRRWSICGDYFDCLGEIYKFGSTMKAMVVVSLKNKELNDMENFSQYLTWHLIWQ